MAGVTGQAVHIRPAKPGDAPAIAAIYNHYITNTVVTFEEEPVDFREMVRRIEEVESFSLPWLVAEQNGAVVAYAYATRWRVRRAYRFSAEVSVYVAPEHGRRGLGSLLYESLFENLRQGGIHAVLGGIALPNVASIALHEKFGFKKVAHLSEVGYKFDRWVDVGYWQLTL